MNLEEKVYKMFILGTEGGGYKTALQNGLGGIIFFTHDIKTIEQFKNLIEECKRLAKYPIFLGIDQEGGRVERTENIHNGKKYLSAKYAFNNGLDFLKKQTQEIAQELVSYGINLNFAPCIDVNTNPNNPIIGERAFSDNPDEVIKAGKVVTETYTKNGIIPCVKHYPGHGDASVDSHLTLPEIDLALEEMEKTHIKPFAACVKDVQMIMVAHLHCTCFDKDEIPTSLSKNAINYLRNKLGFNGVAISDDMVMKGLIKSVKKCPPLEGGPKSLISRRGTTAVVMGVKAGLNMFIYRNSNPETMDIIESVINLAKNDKELAQKIDESYEKISKINFLQN